MERFSQLLLPFGLLHPADRVVIYGSGDVGQTYLHQLRHCGYAVVGIVDRKWDGKSLPFPFYGVDRLGELDFDKLLIAVGSQATAASIRDDLLARGIVSAKLIMPSPSPLSFAVCHQSDAEKMSGDSGEAAARLIAAQCDIPWPEDAAACNVQTSPTEAVSQQRYGVVVVGTGHMAEQMVDTIWRRVPRLEVVAVVSRDAQRGEAFARRHGVETVYGSCAEAARDPRVHLAYIATPVHRHYEQTLTFLHAGKHVLCEKPFALNLPQAREMIEVAQRNKLVLTDGMWPRYMPLAQKLKEVLAQGCIGNVNGMVANLHYPAMLAPRIARRDMGGGFLLETGCYLVALASLVLGKDVKKVIATGILTEDGVDREAGMMLQYPDAIACFSMGAEGVSDRRAMIYGEKGYLCLERANEYLGLVRHDAQGTIVEQVSLPGGYEFELLATLEAIDAGRCFPSAYPHEETLFVLEILDKARALAGVLYTADACFEGRREDR